MYPSTSNAKPGRQKERALERGMPKQLKRGSISRSSSWDWNRG